MAKYKFTKDQFDEIIQLLKRRSTENPTEKKMTRAKIRRIGFKISDYFNGFSNLDFEKLLAMGEIEIIEPRNSLKAQPSEKIILKTASKNSDFSKRGLPPVIDRNTKYLVLGTMPGEESLFNQEYYNNPRNQFWNIISSIYNDGKQFSNYEEKISVLKRNRIGLWDVLHTCEREGSLDSKIKNPRPNDFDKLFNDFSNIKTVIFNGQESYNYFNSLVYNKAEKKYLQLTSTSSANTHTTVNEKKKEWKLAFIQDSR